MLLRHESTRLPADLRMKSKQGSPLSAARGAGQMLAGQRMPIPIEKKGDRAVGIDPGLAATGYAVIEAPARRGELCAWGHIKTSSKAQLPVRLQTIFYEVDALFRQWQPAIVVVEDVYVLDRFPKAAIQLGEVRGVIYLAAQQHGIGVIKIRPTEVKSALTGNGRAPKDQVNRALRTLLRVRENIKPDHASDAAALALVGLSRTGYFVW